MVTTLSVIKADVGSVAGHIVPSRELIGAVREHLEERGRGIYADYYLGSIGDDVAILFSHHLGVGAEPIHKLAWDAFLAGTACAKRQGLYGAGQDLLRDAFAGNVTGMGPAVAEMEFEERPAEPFLLFLADKTEPGAYSLPLYLAFADPMYCPGLMLSPKMGKGFRYTIVDVTETEYDKVIELVAPEELYDLAALLRDNARFVVERIDSRVTGGQAAVCSTTRLHNIAGHYVGKDDPVALVRTQLEFPSTGEIVAPFAIGHYVNGSMRGSHVAPLMPVIKDSPVAFFDGPPMVNALGFCVHEGRLVGPVDLFNHPYWDHVRDNVARKMIEMRRQGFSGPAMLPYAELEYGGIVERLGALETRFTARLSSVAAVSGDSVSDGRGR